MFIENAIEDYAGVDNTHKIYNETKTFSNEGLDRIVISKYGSFFAHSLKVRNLNNNQPLTEGVDYELGHLDERASLKAGKQVVYSFTILNEGVTAISYDYHFIGGVHSNGKYLIDRLNELYPEGIKPNLDFLNIQGRPETYKPAPHIHSAKDLYGFDEINNQLARILHSVDTGVDISASPIQVAAHNELSKLERDLEDTVEAFRDQLEYVFQYLRVQEGEYVITDSLENPGIKRGYGVWDQVRGTVLRGADSDLVVGYGSVGMLGNGQSLRNVYIWKNRLAGGTPTYTLSVTGQAPLNGIYQFNEDVEYEIKLQTTGIEEGTKISWIVTGINNLEITTNSPTNHYGHFVVDDLGQATARITVNNKDGAEGARTATFRLEHVKTANISININDSTRSRWVEAYISHDIGGNFPTQYITEGQSNYLQLTYHGYETGERAYIDWTKSSVLEDEFEVLPPSFLACPSSGKITLGFKVKENHITDIGGRVIVVYIKDSPTDEITSKTSMTFCFVQDNLTSNVTYVEFTKGDENITEIDEGEAFNLVIRSDLINKELDVLYETTKALSDINGLQSQITLNSSGTYSKVITPITDLLTQTGVTLFTVVVFDGDLELARNTLVIKDTSKTPNYTLYITSNDDGTSDGGGYMSPGVGEPSGYKLNEGEKYWLVIETTDWPNPVTPPTLILDYAVGDNWETGNGIEDIIDATFYNRLTYSSTSANYSDVKWLTSGNKTRLMFSFTVKDNPNFSELYQLIRFSAYQSNTEPSEAKVSNGWVADTSHPKIIATWSSSASEMLPIASVNEMTNTFGDNTAYLWLDVENGQNGSNYGPIDIEILQSSVAVASDLIDTYPRRVNFTADNSRLIVSVTFKADWVNENDELLEIRGVYTRVGIPSEAFRTSVVINDNSFRQPISVKVSQSFTDPDDIPADGKFSENSNFYIHVTGEPYGGMTRISLNITSNTLSTHTGRLTDGWGANSEKGVMSIKPTQDFISDGGGRLTGTITREAYVQSSGTYEVISSNSVNITVDVRDDSVPTTLDLKLYSNSARTTEVTTATALNEGQMYYGRVHIVSPRVASRMTISGRYSTDTVVDGVTYLGENSSGRRVISNFSGQVVNSDGTQASYTYDFEITPTADFLSSVNPQKFTMYAANHTYYNYYFDYQDISSKTSDPYFHALGIKTWDVNDNSKFAIYDVSIRRTIDGPAVTSFNEGETFYLVIEITDGMVGHTYTPTTTLSSSYFELDNSGVDQVASIVNDKLIWAFRTKARYTANAPDSNWTVINKTLAKTVGTVAGVTENNTKSLPVMKFLYSKDKYSGGREESVSTTTLDEGDQYQSLYVYSDDLVELKIGHQLFISAHSNGRPTDKWGNSELIDAWTNVVAFANNTSHPVEVRGKRGVRFNVYPNADMTNNNSTNRYGYAIFNASIKADEGYIATVGSGSATINDTSQPRAFTAMGWIDPATGNAITSVNEGKTARFTLRVSGGTDPFSITLTNDGGREIAKLDSHEYGVSKTRYSNNDVLTWEFKIKADGTTNNTTNSRLKIKITDDSGTLTSTSQLPIMDTSNNATATITFLNSSGQTITSIKETDSFRVRVTVSNRVIGANYEYRLENTARGVNSTDSIPSGTGDVTVTSSLRQFQNQGDLTSDSLNTLYAIVYQVINGDSTPIGIATIPVIDVVRPAVNDTDIRICTIADESYSHRASINEGETVRIHFANPCFDGNEFADWNFYWRVVGDTVTPQSGYINQTDLLPGGVYNQTISIPADETTSGDKDIRVELYNIYKPSGTDFDNANTIKVFRGNSAITTVKDTSPLPSIDSVVFARGWVAPDAVSGVTMDITENPGDRYWIVVYATGLTADGSDTTVNLAYSGTSNEADRKETLGTTVTMKLVNAANRTYMGAIGPYAFKTDAVEG